MKSFAIFFSSSSSLSKSENPIYLWDGNLDWAVKIDIDKINRMKSEILQLTFWGFLWREELVSWWIRNENNIEWEFCDTEKSNIAFD